MNTAQEKIYSKLTKQQQFYFDYDLILKEFELKTLKTINDICDNIEFIIKDINSYNQKRVTQQLIDQGFDFYKLLLAMACSGGGGFYRGEATLELVNALYVNTTTDMDGVNYAMTSFFTSNDQFALLDETKDKLKQSFRIIEGITKSHLEMSEHLFLIYGENESMPMRMGLAESMSIEGIGIPLESWDKVA